MRRKLLLVTVVILALAAVWAIGRVAGPRLLELIAAVEGAGTAAPLVFATLYAVAVVALIPGSLLTLAAGTLFGVLRGTVLVFIAATVGASLAFLVARHLARPAVARRLARDARFERIDAAVGHQGAKIVFLLRLTPVVPFNVLNYALGVTRVRFADYLIASVGMLPGTILYVYSGRVAGELALVAAGAPVERGIGFYAVVALGLAASATLVVVLTRLARAALREAAVIGEGEPKTRPESGRTGTRANGNT